MRSANGHNATIIPDTAFVDFYNVYVGITPQEENVLIVKQLMGTNNGVEPIIGKYFHSLFQLEWATPALFLCNVNQVDI